MKNYTIDVNSINDYIRFLQTFQRDAQAEQNGIKSKLEKTHAVWEDKNYLLTAEAVGEIDEQFRKLFASFEISIKSLKQMSQAYSDYLNRRKH